MGDVRLALNLAGSFRRKKGVFIGTFWIQTFTGVNEGEPGVRRRSPRGKKKTRKREAFTFSKKGTGVAKRKGGGRGPRAETSMSQKRSSARFSSKW